MNFKYPIEKVCQVPSALLDGADKLITEFEKSKPYNFKLDDWQRIDSYNNPENKVLREIVGSDIVDYLLPYFGDHVLYGWSISHLPAKGQIVDHCDRMFFHRFAKRIIVVTSRTPDVLNWHWHSDGKTMLPYVLEWGWTYRLNTAYTHGLKNGSNLPRRGFYLDMMPRRLWQKFKYHPDMLMVITQNATGVKYVFQ